MAGGALGFRGIVACAALFGLAVIVRLLFLRGTVDRDFPFSIFYYGDSRLYREFALALIRGDLFDNGIPYHPPLFAFVLAKVIELVGENPAALRAVLAVVASLAVPLTYLVGRQLWDGAVAWTGAFLALFSFGLCVAAVSPNADTIYIPLLLAQALAVYRLGSALAERSTLKGAMTAVASGVLLGLGSLTRAEHLALAAVVPLALLLGWPGAGLRRIAGATLVTLVAGLLVIAPWTIHNYRALTRFNAEHPDLAEPLPAFVLVSNYGGLNFALANGPGSDGSFKPDAIVSATGGDQLDLSDPRQLSIYLHGYRQGLTFLAKDPAGSARLIARKLAIGLDALSLGFGLSDWPGGLKGSRRAVDMFTPDSKLLLPVSLVLSALGAWVSRSLWRRGSTVWLIIAHKVLICAAFFGYVRLFVPLLPFLFLLQASALTAGVSALPSLFGRLRSRTMRSERGETAGLRSNRARTVTAVVGLALATGLLAELWIRSGNPRKFVFSGSSDPSNGKLIQDAPMTLSPRP